MKMMYGRCKDGEQREKCRVYKSKREGEVVIESKRERNMSE